VIVASAFSSAHDFFHSSAWYVIRNLALLLVVVFWIATIYWVYKDATRRIADRLIVWVATAVGVVPFVGPLIYMLFRPPEYLEDVHERDLEIKAIERRLARASRVCPVCRAEVDDDYLVCPICTTKLRRACVGCQRPLEEAWKVCPYCETPIEDDPLAVELTQVTPTPKPRTRRKQPSG
jgi:RNA polymerase subunit RPABC4/transcription elongation factor Spt4